MAAFCIYAHRSHTNGFWCQTANLSTKHRKRLWHVSTGLWAHCMGLRLLHEEKMEYMKADTKVNGYMVYPRFLSTVDVSPTEKIVYVYLFNRARSSQRASKSGKFTDQLGCLLYTSDAADERSSVHRVSHQRPCCRYWIHGTMGQEVHERVGRSRIDWAQAWR